MPVALGGLALADLLTLLAWLVCLGLVIVWKHTIGAGIIWVANELDKAAVSLPEGIGTIHLFGPITSALRTVEKNVANWLGEAALATEHATLFLWNHTVSIVEEAARWVEDVTLTEVHAWESLFTKTLPGLYHSIVHFVEHAIRAAASDTRHAESVIQRDVTREIHRVETKTEAIVDHAEAVISADVLPRIRTAEHDINALKAKLESIASQFTKAGIVALIGATIWKELFNGVKCSSWGNLVNKWGCGAWKVLDGLLGLVVSGLLLTNVCDMLGLLETAYGDVAGPLISFLTEIPLGGCEVPPASWAQLNVAAGALPPPQTLGTLPS